MDNLANRKAFLLAGATAAAATAVVASQQQAQAIGNNFKVVILTLHGPKDFGFLEERLQDGFAIQGFAYAPGIGGEFPAVLLVKQF